MAGAAPSRILAARLPRLGNLRRLHATLTWHADLSDTGALDARHLAERLAQALSRVWPAGSGGPGWFWDPDDRAATVRAGSAGEGVQLVVDIHDDGPVEIALMLSPAAPPESRRRAAEALRLLRMTFPRLGAPDHVEILFWIPRPEGKGEAGRRER